MIVKENKVHCSHIRDLLMIVKYSAIFILPTQLCQKKIVTPHGAITKRNKNMTHGQPLSCLLGTGHKLNASLNVNRRSKAPRIWRNGWLWGVFILCSISELRIRVASTCFSNGFQKPKNIHLHHQMFGGKQGNSNIFTVYTYLCSTYSGHHQNVTCR